MIKKAEYEQIKKEVLERLDQAKIILTEEEKNNIEIADFGLEDIYIIGLQLITYINTNRVCVKELILLPNQTCPEHYHPPFNDYEGKEETFRCRQGEVYLYVEGEPTENPKVKPPKETADYYSVFKEIHLMPGEQYTINENTKHWFKAGNEGAIISEFSTPSYDERDIFTNPNITREPEVER